ncbi:MAG TPA: GDP-mannose 4,6-dehydratase [bacterium]|uniref:UDP-glucuronate decarboxylase n=1 Tax=candidate division TA06 bacterium ADurb.Bin417 TaxID=1852828 RepID=A0A1V5MDZ0_UNCT6|nr:MAG: Bifunctional polymyxin resistance protein ArnA [candidate division TA06 bacterium ADurb.Bin417]HNQ35182.1 GDP-mannose 4,6-dehydratase [bacterium]HNS47954.1 GDP-mannose 4,6-dehydratase [bacterium]
MRYLITGGAGFIGSHLTEHLLPAGHRVTVLDDLSTGRLKNLEAVKHHPNLQILVDSILNRPVLERLVGEADAVFHLAAAVGVRTVIEQPLQSLRTNVEGTCNLLEACAAARRKIVLASTSEVYGKNENVPFAEENDIVLGATTIRRWAYACSKALDEFFALAYAAEAGLPVIIVRLFNTIGPRQTGRYGMVVPRFVRQALEGRPITIYGDGRQSRCFTCVSDVIEALGRLVESPAAVGGVFNIGSREEVTIEDLARRIRTLCKSRSPLVHLDPEQDYKEGFEDMRRRVPDLTRLEATIGYRPRVSLETALKQIIADFKAGRED